MTGNLRRIEKNAEALTEKLIDLGDRFNDAYDRYLQALAPAVQQQTILAVYHLCTQGYPARFLRLSVADRAALQSEIQQLARQARETFERYFSEEEEGEEVVGEEFLERAQAGIDGEQSVEVASRAAEIAEAIGAIDFSTLREIDLGREAAADAPTDSERTKPEFAGDESADDNDSDRDDADSDTDSDADADASGFDRDNAQLFALALQAKLQAKMEEEDEDAATPGNLLMWQRSIEGDIAKMLHELSVQANQLLQSRDILPKEFPPGLFEAIGRGGGDGSEALSGSPNVLQLTIEAGETDDESKVLVRFLAMNLRLPEIEFADAAVSQPRHAIRKLLAELSGLRKRWATNQRELTIAKAEAAWRSTWSEERDD